MKHYLTIPALDHQPFTKESFRNAAKEAFALNPTAQLVEVHDFFGAQSLFFRRQEVHSTTDIFWDERLRDPHMKERLLPHVVNVRQLPNRSAADTAHLYARKNGCSIRVFTADSYLDFVYEGFDRLRCAQTNQLFSW